MDWNDIEVGDIISIQIRSEQNHQIFTGEITQIRHYNRQTDTTLDPLAYYISDDYYEFRIKIQRRYGFREYVISSLCCNLINIQKKGKDNMPLEIGKVYKVKFPQAFERPGQDEFVGELIQINRSKVLTHLVYSKQLEEDKKGHCGDGYTREYGCWWCRPEWLKEEPEADPIEFDLFKV